nr:GDSL esterase/lipase At5g42170-like [Malus domestica]
MDGYRLHGRRGIKELLAAYLDPNLQREDIPTGGSFASGGSGCAPLTPTVFLFFSKQQEVLSELYPKFSDLYSLGTTRFGFFSAVAIGCTPLERSSTGLLGECFKLQNQRAELFNSMLSTELDYINANFTDAKLVFLDI